MSLKFQHDILRGLRMLTFDRTEEIMRRDPPLYQDWVNRTPVGKLGTPKDIAGAAVFLLSDASSYMTGSDVVIDGGYTCI